MGHLGEEMEIGSSITMRGQIHRSFLLVGVTKRAKDQDLLFVARETGTNDSMDR